MVLKNVNMLIFKKLGAYLFWMFVQEMFLFKQAYLLVSNILRFII